MNSLDGRSRAHQLESIQMNMSVQWHLVCVWLTVISCGTAYAQERTQQHMVVSAEAEEAEHDQFTEMGEYAQPAWGAQPVFFDDECLRVIALRNVCWKYLGS
jgi:septal ring-binding cell division protein DamX